MSGWTFNTDASTVIAQTIRDFEDFRDLVTSIENKFGATTVSKYAYLSDNLGRRTRRIDSGSVFTAQTQEAFGLFGYNDRNELTGQNRYAGTDPQDTTNPIPAEIFDYAYDPIGNRTMYVQPGGPAQTFTTYTANNLNQYTATAEPTESFTHDNRGNMTADGSNTYTWDAENRLVEVAPASPPVEADKRLTYAYDYRGRRVQKQVETYTSGAWVVTADSRFVYDGWNLLGELDALDSSNPVARYTWGLGGLLAVHDHVSTDDYLYFHDANGNVGQLIDHSGTVVAHYEYDPYGGEVHASGSYAAANPFRFSTKYLDAEIEYANGPDGLYYYGFRYYSPRLGRWMSRDPLEEDGGTNLNEFVRGSPTNLQDALGLAPSGSPFNQTGTIIGPEAKVVSYIAKIGDYTALSADLIQEYTERTGETLTKVRSDLILTAVQELAISANPDPPATFLGTPTWKQFVADKEYRGFLFFTPMIKCCRGEVIAAGLPSSGLSHGYTPSRNVEGGKANFYLAGDGRDSLTGSLTRGGGCHRFVWRHEFRLGKLGRIATVLMVGMNVPYPWHEIDYTLCCDGSQEIIFSGSNFPSHTSYINNTWRGNRYQTGLIQAIWAGAGVTLPGGQFDP